MNAAAATLSNSSSSHDPPSSAPGKGALWAGRILSGLMAAFLFLDAGMKLALAKPAVEGSAKLGFTPSSLVGMGAALALGTLLYLVPRTAVLGAIIVTGYLGGAVAINVQTHQPAFNISFPVIIGVLTWLGLWLRDLRLRALTPIRA